ncbi:MAG: hypothetical protein WD226_07820 [Planctomycetota bacterium]
MKVVEPRGHARAIERLWRSAAEGRLPHALFFEGPSGIGKGVAARWFAAGLLCAEGPGPPCGQCGPCRRVVSGGEGTNHADLFVLDPVAEGEETIKVERIAEREGHKGPVSMLKFLNLEKLEGRWRPLLLLDAHRMTTAAQNALLKTLEEPRPGTVLVLVTHRVDALLATILSRVVRVRLEPLAAEDCAALLATEGFEPAELERLTRWAEGSPGEALRLATTGAAEMLDVIAAALEGDASPFALARRVWELEGAFEGEKATALARARARAFLHLLLAVLRDRLRVAAGVGPESLPFGEFARTVDERRDRARLDAAFTALADVERNLAAEAALERALVAAVDPREVLRA